MPEKICEPLACDIIANNNDIRKNPFALRDSQDDSGVSWDTEDAQDVRSAQGSMG